MIHSASHKPLRGIGRKINFFFLVDFRWHVWCSSLRPFGARDELMRSSRIECAFGTPFLRFAQDFR